MIDTCSGIIKAKLNTPALNKNCIQRKRLEQKFGFIQEYEITIITAPAGYGKTTAAANYLIGTNCISAWFSIDESDNDPVLFWQYVTSALSLAHPVYEQAFDDLAISWEIVQNNIISKLLLEKLYRIPDETIFVMDDFHLINHPAILENLKYIAKYLPENFRILIISRSELDERLSVMLSKGKVLRIGREDLIFDVFEISEFYEKRGILLNSKEIHEVLNYTEGWAAGLVMSLIASDKNEFMLNGFSCSAGSRYINKLFNDEVFLKWPEKIRRFLVQTSILNRFSVPLCCAITGFDDCADIIEALSETNSFLVPLDDSGEWYRYHQLFSEYLRTKLEKDDTETIPGLYRSAGLWYIQNGCLREAIHALIKGGDYENAIRLFWDVFLPMAGGGEFLALSQWLSAIPKKVHKNSASYCFIYAYLLDMENLTEQADYWYDKALTAFEDKNYHMFEVENQDMLLKMLVLCKSGIAIRRMDVKGVVACYEEASQFDLPALDHGETNAYQPSLLKTYSLFYGRITLILEAFTPIYECLAKCHGKTIAYSNVGEAEIYYVRNLLDECQDALMKSFEAVRELNYSGVTVPFFFTLAKVKRARGDMDGAFETVAECKKRIGPNALWEYIIDIFTAGLYLEMNDIQAAESLLRFCRMSIFDEIFNTNEFEMFTYARYLLQTGDTEKSVILLNRLYKFAQKENRFHSQIETLSLLSVAYYLNDDKDNAVTTLDIAIELGMEDGYVRAFLDTMYMKTVLSRYINERKSGSNKKRNYAQRLYRLMANQPQIAFVAENGGEKPLNRLLTQKELQVLTLVSNGCSNLDIAVELGISENTVKYHTKNIFSKLEVKNRQSAVNKAKLLGL